MSNKAALPINANCTEPIASNIRHEFRMFDWLEAELSRHDAGNVPGSGNPSNDNMHYSALLESFLLHTRILLDFFGPTRSQDDCLAIDFANGWTTAWVAKCSYLDEQRRKKLNKLLAHPSATRESYNGNKQWDHTMIHGELSSLIAKFRAQLSPQQQAWFQ